MPAADWRSDEFLLNAKRRGNISTSVDGWDDDDLLAMATDEMRDSIVPMLRRLSEEFLVNDYDQNIASGTAAYSLPDWALGEALRDVQLYDGSGGYHALVRKEPSDVSAVAASNRPTCYFLRDSKVVLVPTPTTAVTSGLRLRCLRRPSKLVGLGRGFEVDAIDLDTGYVDVSPLSGADTLYSLHGTDTPDVEVTLATPGFRVPVESGVTLDPAQVANYDKIAFTLAQAAMFSVGDVVTLTGESVVPQIPAELHALLAQATVCSFLRASGQPGLEAAEAKRQMMWAEAEKLFSPRTENQPRFVHNRYGCR